MTQPDTPSIPAQKPSYRPGLTGILLLALAQTAVAAASDSTPPCNRNDTPAVWLSPAQPGPGQPIRLMAADLKIPLHTLTLTDSDGSSRTLPATRLGGPPWGLNSELPAPGPGHQVLSVNDSTGSPLCSLPLAPGINATTRPASSLSGWTLPHDILFALWIERLFLAPPEQGLSFPSLEPVLRDPERNFLHGYLGQGEDARLPATPDCADLPYYLRAYFAWKMGLPFSSRACNRGSAQTPPRCEAAVFDTLFINRRASVGEFKSVLRPLLDRVHSGSARTRLNDDATDFYPLPLQREVLWPGTVYADPYGHVLMIAQWLPQKTASQAGILYAVDAQPDNSVARKRYWEGNFLYTNSNPGSGPGFKAFRPIAGQRHLLSNAELQAERPYSTEQAAYDTRAFHARMSQLINPQGLSPDASLNALITALTEQLETRVGSVDNGTRYVRQHPGSTIPMPQGAAIFETTGAWEDYATPSRDLRLLIALDVLAKLPEQIRRYPELFTLNGVDPARISEELATHLETATQTRTIRYIRSDGSEWPLSLEAINARKNRLEMAYNPNDCPEIRWGASPGTAEYQTCRRQAPPEQKSRMENYRVWFHEAKRPPR